MLEVVVQALLHDVLGSPLECSGSAGDDCRDEILTRCRIGVDICIDGRASGVLVARAERGLEAFAGLGHIGQKTWSSNVRLRHGVRRSAESPGNAEHHERGRFLRVGDIASVQKCGIDEVFGRGQTLRTFGG